jgi:hypothetical protein
MLNISRRSLYMEINLPITRFSSYICENFSGIHLCNVKRGSEKEEEEILYGKRQLIERGNVVFVS